MQKEAFRASIIITSYNRADYLVESVDSVINQTLRPHEIIIADDCSTDGSQDVIREYTARHPGWVRGIFQPRNAGIPANRNTALRAVTGNYVGILDGDDRFMPDKLERQYQALRDAPGTRAVYGNFRRVGPDGEFLSLRYEQPQAEGDILAAVAMLNYGLLRTLLAEYSAVVKAGFMDERYTKFDGFWLSLQLAAFCRFAYIHTPLLDKKEYPGSDSRKNTLDELIHDLSGIRGDMQPLLQRLTPHEIGTINRTWQETLDSYTRLASNRDSGRVPR